MQQTKRQGLKFLLIAAFALSVSVTCSAQTVSSTTAPQSPQNHAQQDSETLKRLEIANIRLKAANEQIALLNDRLVAKDEIIKAKDGTIAVRDEQLALAKSANQDRAAVNTGDAVMLRACEQQLSRADSEIARLRNPGFFRSVFDTRTLTGAVIGFGLGKIAK